jgi:hypothetical protein
MDLKPKSHISISSTDSNKNTFNYYKNKGKTENRKNESINSNIEKEMIKKLIIISLKNKKFLERNDYFFSETKRQRNNKKIKLKLTPFQLYEKFKKFAMKKQLSNKYINSYPYSENRRSRNKINNLLTITNYRRLKKNPTYAKHLCLTNTNSNFNYNNLYRNFKPKNKAKIFISSIDNSKKKFKTFSPYKSNLNIRRHMQLTDSYDNKLSDNLNSNIIRNEINQLSQNSQNSYRCRTISNNFYLKKKVNLPHTNIKNIKTIQNVKNVKNIKNMKNTKSVGVFTTMSSLGINFENRNRNFFRFPLIKDNKKFQIPLICLNKNKFLKDIKTKYN